MKIKTEIKDLLDGYKPLKLKYDKIKNEGFVTEKHDEIIKPMNTLLSEIYSRLQRMGILSFHQKLAFMLCPDNMIDFVESDILN